MDTHSEKGVAETVMNRRCEIGLSVAEEGANKGEDEWGANTECGRVRLCHNAEE